MNAELISLIKWYIFDDGSIQNKLLNLQGEQLNKERLSIIIFILFNFCIILLKIIICQMLM